MPSTYTPIATTTLGSDTNSVTLSSIPSTYTDLILIIIAQNTTNANEIYGRFNSDTGSNYSFTNVTGTGSAATSNRGSNSTTMRFGFCNNDLNSNAIVQIMNYSNTTTYKTALSRANNPSSLTMAVANLWRSTSAISSINLTMESGANFIAGSTFTLYGVKSA